MKSQIVHLAGIVPIAGQPLDFEMPWHDSLMPVSKDYLAIERAIYQCALAGCESIWVVGHLGTQPLVRKRAGESIFDPKYFSTNPLTFNMNREISIYYVPIHPKDRQKRDCLGWSTIYGAQSSYRVCNFISKWTAPEKFFVSFPYGISPDGPIEDNRTLISSKKNVLFSYGGKTVKDNLHIPFTFDIEDFFRCRDILKKRQTDDWSNNGARFYDLSTVFKGLDTSLSSVIDLPWYHEISGWEGYKNYLASEQSKLIVKPSGLFNYKSERLNEKNN